MIGSTDFGFLSLEFVVRLRNTGFIFCNPKSKMTGACSSAWLERTPDKREVDGSTPSRPTRLNIGNWVRREGQDRFSVVNHKSLIIKGGVAQLGERLPCTQEAIGSNPFTSTTLESYVRNV